MTTDPTVDGPGDKLPARKRPRRSHAAAGSRVLVSGLAISGTIGLAGAMAHRPPAVAGSAGTPRETLLAVDARSPFLRPPKAAKHRSRAGVAAGAPPARGALTSRGTAAHPLAVVGANAPAPSTVSGGGPAAPPSSPVPAAGPSAPVPGAPAPTTPPVSAPPPVGSHAPVPTTAPPTSAAPPPPVIVPTTAPPTTTSHASPPPP